MIRGSRLIRIPHKVIQVTKEYTWLRTALDERISSVSPLTITYRVMVHYTALSILAASSWTRISTLLIDASMR